MRRIRDLVHTAARGLNYQMPRPISSLGFGLEVQNGSCYCKNYFARFWR